MNIELRLAELIGPCGRTAAHGAFAQRSGCARFPLYIRATLDVLDKQIEALQIALAEKAWLMPATVMPGFTHLQRRNPSPSVII